MSDAFADEYAERPGRDPVEYLEIPLRYRRHVLVPVAVSMVIAAFLVWYAPRKYQSSTLILVESKSLPPEYFVTPASAQAIGQRLQTIRQVALSRSRLEEVIRKLDPYPELHDEPIHVVVEAMRLGIQIRVQGMDSFTFEYTNRDPQKAMLVTAMMATQFIQDSDHLRQTLSDKTFSLLQANLATARKNLDSREQALGDFQQKNWGALPEQLDSNLRMLQQLQVEQQTLGDSMRTLEGRRQGLENALIESRRRGEAAGTAPTGAAAELAKLKANYENLRGRYTDDHPDMRILRARMEHLEKRIVSRPPGAGDDESTMDPQTAALRKSLSQAEGEIESVNLRRTRLDKTIAEYRARIEATPKARQGLAALNRDYGQLREEYNSALKKEKDAEMAHRIEEFWRFGYFRVLDPAYIPGRPIMPYTLIFLGGGLALGLALGSMAAIVADQLDRTVRTERELSDILRYPVLVTVDHAPRPDGKTRMAEA